MLKLIHSEDTFEHLILHLDDVNDAFQYDYSKPKVEITTLYRMLHYIGERVFSSKDFLITPLLTGTSQQQYIASAFKPSDFSPLPCRLGLLSRIESYNLVSRFASVDWKNEPRFVACVEAFQVSI